MSGPYVSHWGPLFPQNDAAPAATGAHVGNPETAPDPKQTIPAPARRNAPPGTSEVSAQRIATAAPSLRDMVLALLRERGARGATDQEIQAELGLPSNTQIPRRWELVNLGLVVDSGERRPTPSGRRAAVWALANIARNGPCVPPAASSPTDAPEGGAR
jgi:hypothetical protein